MTREELYRRIKERPLILDGATGSNLQKAGMPAGVCPELWILEHPDVFLDLQRAYVRAGSDILYAPTFSGNRIKLSEYGIGDRVAEINKGLVKLSRQAAEGKALVAGDMTMTGQSLAPVGTMEIEELIDVYREQASCLVDAGVDLFVIETMMSLGETRAAVLGIREVTDLPIIASLTFQEDGRTLYGTDPVTAVVVLQSLGADVIGVNCSTGPEEMIPVVRQMREYAKVPLLAKPNAGLPVLVDGKTVYPMEADEFASYGPEFIKSGVSLIGGCCGTGPDHIAALSEALKGMKPLEPDNRHPSVLASERHFQEIRVGGPFLVIGERINPTGKKDLREELRQGRLDIVEQYAQEQEEMGAHILDVNMGTNGIDEKEMMLAAIDRITMISSLPLSIDTSYVDVMEAALRRYPGRALVNSVSLEENRIRQLLPLVKKYGAMFVLLPLSDQGLPADSEEKKKNIQEILRQSDALGIPREDIIVDGLVTTAGANKKAALETLDTIAWCREQNLLTTIGLSNISFGLPERPYVNGAFAAMAIAAGLTSAIANPSNHLLMGISYAADLLQNKEGADNAYIDQIARMAPYKEKQASFIPSDRQTEYVDSTNRVDPPEDLTTEPDRQPDSPIYEAVLKGNRKGIKDMISGLMSGQDVEPGEVISDLLIPAISEVGSLFERGVYFLPQLIAGAAAMQDAVNYLEPMMKKTGEKEDLPVIVIATVEGDIHDIGKNLVAMMIRNYGYQVIDLGKDVPARTIIDCAKENRAAIIVLSALMTTTMMKMKETIDLRNAELPGTKVMIGGAVTTPDFAREIGADGYSKDAAEAVKLVKRLLGETDE